MRTALVGLAALAAALSITMSTVVPVHAAELPQSASDGVSANASSCRIYGGDLHQCDRTWWPGGSPDPGESSTDTASLKWNNGQWLIFGACDHNNDGVSIGIQIDPSDGRSDYYTKRPPTLSCSGEPESRLIHRFRFVAVNSSGTPTGTPTAWETPPWGAGPA